MKNIILSAFTISVGLLCFSTLTFGQKSLNAAGGDIQSSAGSVSYTIGQIDYTSSSGPDGSVNRGVQQPFEFFTVGIDDYPEIVLSCRVFPNPTADFITLSMDDFDNLPNFSWVLFDFSGKTISENTVSAKETQIFMNHLTPGSYLLRVATQKNTIKTFKIIKH
jgi:hypothetical protein